MLIQRRDRLWQQAQQYPDYQNLEEAVAAAETVLEIEQAVFGTRHQELLGTHEFLCDRYLMLDQMPKAVFHARERLEIASTVFDKGDHRTVSAEWNVSYVRLLAKAERTVRAEALALERKYSSNYKDKQYDRAAEAIKKVMELEEQILGAEHPFYANSLMNLADCLMKQERYKEAIDAAEQAYRTRSKKLGSTHPDTGWAAFRRARAEFADERYLSSASSFSTARDIWLAAGDISNAAWMDSWRGDCFKRLSDIDQARKAFTAARDRFVEIEDFDGEALQIGHLDDLSPGFEFRRAEHSRLSQEAVSALEAENLKRAARLGERVLAIQKALFRENSKVLIHSLRWLSNVYEQSESWDRSRECLLEVQRRLSRDPSAKDWQRTDARLDLEELKALRSLTPADRKELNQAADVIEGAHKRYNAGDYGEAIKQYQACHETRRDVLGENHRKTLSSLNHWADACRRKGDYAQAASILVKSVENHKNKLGVDHPEYARTLNLRAELYRETGDYARAEPIYVKALRILTNSVGENHIDFSTTLNNLALAYKQMKNYERAETLYKQSLKTSASLPDEYKLGHAQTLSNLAVLYRVMGKLEQAEDLYRGCLEIQKEKLPANHPDYALTLSNMGQLCRVMGALARAQRLQERALKIYEISFADDHPLLATARNNLAGILFLKGEHGSAFRQSMEALAISRRLLEDASSFLSESRQLAMAKKLRYQQNSVLSFGLDLNSKATELAGVVHEWKGAVTFRQRAMRMAARDPAVGGMFEELQSIARQLSTLSREMIQSRTPDWEQRIVSLTKRKERLEAAISAESRVFRSASEDFHFGILQRALPSQSRLVDYFVFEHWTQAEGLGKWNKTESLFVSVLLEVGRHPGSESWRGYPN